MGLPRRLTPTRLAEILRRQRPPQFGSAYEPAIRASKEEATSESRPVWVWSERLGRDVATFSEAERAILPIALCCPWLFDLQEQRMLPFLPDPHPLHGHPLAAGLELMPFRGTLTVASELHHLGFHPFVTVQREDGAVDVPGCFIGDFLLFLRDTHGPFCKNLNVKSTRAEFEMPQVGVTVKTDLARASAKEKARHEVERYLYADIDIETIEVAGDELPPFLIANVRQLLLWQKRRPALTAEQVETVLDAFREGLERGASALEVITATELSHRIGAYDQKIVFYQAVFSRKLRIDLFESHIFIDKEMRLEAQDPLEVFGHWFRRTK